MIQINIRDYHKFRKYVEQYPIIGSINPNEKVKKLWKENEYKHSQPPLNTQCIYIDGNWEEFKFSEEGIDFDKIKDRIIIE